MSSGAPPRLTGMDTSPTTHAPVLTGKNAVLFGASGSVGSALAREFAAQGASVFVSGRRLEPVQQLADAIQRADGVAHAAEVDALNEPAVTAYLDRVRQQAGSIDILFNVMGPQPREFSHGRPTLDVPLEHYLLPLTTLVRSQFITGRAAGRHMVAQGSGVILFLTAIPARGLANAAAIGSAFGAMESLARCLAIDLGPSGVRVVCIRAGGMVDTRTIQQSVDTVARQQSVAREQVLARFEQATLLKRLTTADDTARLAAFLASDQAQSITGAIVNASSGHIMD